ncbi:MAG: dipeptide epimerase [Bacteroidetes bacterium]|nr:dipeptide epimerase [Bacteroidota bacterium]
MKLTLIPYQLQFKYPFKIAHGTRTHTDVVYVKLEHEGLIAWGEATLPPYLPETQSSVIGFLTAFTKPLLGQPIENWAMALEKVNDNLSAKAALDIALWDMRAQMAGKTIGELLGIEAKQYPYGTYTIGVGTAEQTKEKVDYAIGEGFELFKIKLNGYLDEDKIEHYAACTDKPFAVDMNQAWREAGRLLEFTNDFLAKYNCVLVEQPLHKDAIDDMRFLKGVTSLPVYADESCQRLSDIERLRNSFDGINIKLMKCGGITEAMQMIKKARELDMQILIGCMSESSVGCTAAAHLTPLADYADLDGPYLVANDPFTGVKMKVGRININPTRLVELNFGV